MEISIGAKIIKAVKDGTLLRICLDRYWHFYYVKNKNAEFLVKESKVYSALQKKYQYVLDEDLHHLPEARTCNIVWICWLQGIENAPPLVKACVESIRRNMPDKKIVIITNENIDKYIQLPDYIIQKKEKGIIPPAHYSDIIRCALLCKYGGIWCDATLLCTSPDFPAYISKLPLFVFKEVDLTRADSSPALASSWLIAAKSHQRILIMTLKLLYAYWKKENVLKHYFVFHLFFAMSARKYADDWKNVPAFNNHSPHALMFELGEKFSEERWKQILKMSDFHKLTRHLDYSENKNNFYHHIINKYLPENTEEKASTTHRLRGGGLSVSGSADDF